MFLDDIYTLYGNKSSSNEYSIIQEWWSRPGEGCLNFVYAQFYLIENDMSLSLRPTSPMEGLLRATSPSWFSVTVSPPRCCSGKRLSFERRDGY